MAQELIWLPDVLGAAGLPIQVGPDFATWARPYPMDLWGGIWHHTASPTTSKRAVDIAVVHNGNSVAPGPIAHILSCREQPRLYLVSSGYCNNAGKGWWPGGTDSGNKRAVAMEWVNNGIGEPAHPESVEVSARAWAAIFEHLEWPLDRLWTHHAYAPTRKIDPAAPADFTNNQYRTWTLADVRGQVAKYMKGNDDMGNFVPLTDEVRQLDTRWPNFSALEPFNPDGTPRVYPIGKHVVVPANAIALAMNVTYTNAAGPGFISLWAQDRPMPPTSKLNLNPGLTIPNMLIQPVSGGRYNIMATARTDVILDIVGYFV